MKIGWHPNSKNPRKAGVRLRCLYPMSELKARGFDVDFYDVGNPHKYQTLVIDAWSFFSASEKDADQLLNSVINFHNQGGRLIIDNCDNPFYTEKKIPHWERGQERLRHALKVADHWVLCSEVLGAELRKHVDLIGSKENTVIGDPIEPTIKVQEDNPIKSLLSWRRKRATFELLRYRYKLSKYIRKGATPIVWFGNHGIQAAEGGMNDILSIASYLEAANQKSPLVLGIISNHFDKYKNLAAQIKVPTVYLEWDRTTFIDALKLHKLAIIPIQDNPFTRCKSNNRLLLALYHGLGVIADKMPAYIEFESMCQLGNWEAGLKEYINHPEILEKHLAEARTYMEKQWMLKNIADQWQYVLNCTDRI